MEAGNAIHLVKQNDFQENINTYVTNGLSHPCHLDEFIFILGASGLIFHFYFIFDENYVSIQNSPRCDVCSFLMSHRLNQHSFAIRAYTAVIH